MQYGEQLNESSDNIAAIIEQLVATVASLQSVITALEDLSPPDEEVDYNANPFDITKGRV